MFSQLLEGFGGIKTNQETDTHHDKKYSSSITRFYVHIESWLRPLPEGVRSANADVVIKARS